MGGAETLVKEYALGIDKTKFNLTVLCLDNLHSPYDTLLAQHKIPVIYLSDYMPFYGKKTFLARAFNWRQYYYLARKFLRRLRPDILHVHLPLNHYVKFAALPQTTRIFYTQHFDVSCYPTEYPKDIEALRELIVRHPTQLIALNEPMRRELNELFHVTNTVVLNNGINLARFQQAKPKSQIRRELGIAQDAFVLGHVGRFAAVKNQTFLIDVAAEISKRNPNTWLLLVGAGEDRARLEEKLRVCGLKNKALVLSDRSDIPDLLSAMDRFVFPSVSEGMPLALIEAQVAGLPCIVSQAVPEAAKISNLLTFKSLQQPVAEWADAVLAQAPAPQYTRLEEWDIAVAIRQLEKLYESSTLF